MIFTVKTRRLKTIYMRITFTITLLASTLYILNTPEVTDKLFAFFLFVPTISTAMYCIAHWIISYQTPTKQDIVVAEAKHTHPQSEKNTL